MTLHDGLLLIVMLLQHREPPSDGRLGKVLRRLAQEVLARTAAEGSGFACGLYLACTSFEDQFPRSRLIAVPVLLMPLILDLRSDDVWGWENHEWRDDQKEEEGDRAYFLTYLILQMRLFSSGHDSRLDWTRRRERSAFASEG